MNLATAAAPAQEDSIYDRLPTQLDWSSVKLVEVDFDTFVIIPDIPSNLATAQASISVDDYRPEVDSLLEVAADAQVNVQTGSLRWVFTTLDPDTGNGRDQIHELMRQS
jgi:hypothetical protein